METHWTTPLIIYLIGCAVAAIIGGIVYTFFIKVYNFFLGFFRKIFKLDFSESRFTQAVLNKEIALPVVIVLAVLVFSIGFAKNEYDRRQAAIQNYQAAQQAVKNPR